MKARDIYLLNPKELSPEVIAVAFAKTSRSPESFREIAAELTDEKSAEFHDKWVVGYGHASVAEHAVLHLALENVSRLAIEAIESNRLASYTEKSTRYQVFDRDAYYTPANIVASKYADLYRDTIHLLFDTYFASIEPVRAVILSKYPCHEGENDKRYEGRIRSKWIDNCRYLLPTATLANVGMTANARALEHAISKLMSHPLEEVREIGVEMKRVAQGEVPTLVKYAKRSEYLEKQIPQGHNAVRNAEDGRQNNQAAREAVKLVDYDQDAEAKVVAAFLYRAGGIDFEQALTQAHAMTAEQHTEIIGQALADRGEFDVPLRELEHTTLTLDCLMDQGAYFDVKRHRIMTQTPQPLTVELGYAVPKAIAEAGFAAEYDRAMQAAALAYREIAKDFPCEAAYVVPNAYNRRVLLTLNLRELFHFTQLRGAPNGHFAYRHIALQAYEIAKETYPAFAPFMRCETYPSSAEIASEFFART
ncbi:MAG: FAD-dependent thymidylate synthase [Chloroflexi bacterium]|nr:FAD-dependent thymidylate synthase [Chloroflexota bacterium]